MRALVLTWLVYLLAINNSWAAESFSKRFGDYEVFYTVLNTTFIEPDIAQRYGITRGKDKALVNVAVHRHLPKGQTVAESASVTGTRYDLIHTVPLVFKEFREGDAIYYIAELSFRDKELLSFTLKIQPEQSRSFTVKFNHTLYVEE